MEYYKQYSLKEGFSSLDITLQVPYREPSKGNMPRAITKAGSGEYASQTPRFPCLTGGNATSSVQVLKSEVVEIIFSICFEVPEGWCFTTTVELR